jgi:hypothetical protein
MQNLDFESEVGDGRVECPDVGAGPRGLVISAPVTHGVVADTAWRYLSVWALANTQGAWPAVPESSLNVLKDTFANLTVPALEDLATRCNATYLVEELEATGPKGSRFALERKSAYGRKQIQLVVVAELMLDNELIHAWRSLAKQMPFKRSLKERARRELSDAALYVDDLVRCKLVMYNKVIVTF